jgi:hypothetical protein
MRLLRFSAASFFAAILLLPAVAADAKIEGVKLGETIVGPKLKPDDLKGHVVLVELWGVH